jgi:cysteine desulfurase
VIYLDNNATTRPSDGVAAAMVGALTEYWHNPSSVHRAGMAARRQVDLARADVAALIGVPAKEIVFTSGGTEAIDLAIRGVLDAARGPKVVVSTKIEHAAVSDLLEDLAKRGVEVRWAPVGNGGIVDLARLGPLLEGAVLASIQWANNETGAIQPVREIQALCRAKGVLYHCDGTQWVGKENTSDVAPSDERGTTGTQTGTHPHSATPIALPCDLLTFSPHKFHGPKGVGVLWSRRGLALKPTIHGTQELGRRGGTENVPGILGAGVASREAREWLSDPSRRDRLRHLRDGFERLVLEGVPDARVNGPVQESGARLWNTTNIGFPRLEAEAVLLLLSERGVCASAGAACSSGSLDPSPVLLAMGVPAEYAHGSVRFSLSKETTEVDVEQAAQVVVECVRKLRASMPK